MIEGENVYCEECYRELVLENETLQIKISELLVATSISKLQVKPASARSSGEAVSEKYCPAGKCECLHFHLPHHCGLPDPHFGETNLEQIEVCPWPSRQMRVEIESVYHIKTYDDGFAAGRAYQSEKDREAVKKCRKYPQTDDAVIIASDLYAAIEAAKGEA